MDDTTPKNIILIGFSTTGKSQVGRRLAERLGRGFVDTDEAIEVRARMTIPQIFTEQGEPRFRQWESQVLAEVCQGRGQVIATGGGVVKERAHRELMRRRGMVVLLEATSETIKQRHQADEVVRPLLEGKDLAEIAAFKDSRQPLYEAAAHWIVPTDDLSLDEVVDEVMAAWEQWRDGVAAEVRTPTARYPIYIGWGTLSYLADYLLKVGLPRVVHIVSDETVFARYGAWIERLLRLTSFQVDSQRIPPGEASKTLEQAACIYDRLVERRVERGQPILALGGGVVGDLGGFVAATYLRGLPLVHLPTTLLAMVDASIGGKVAVNHPQGKNLIGAFYQPRLVVADVSTLRTLDRRELVSGWAEVIKHAITFDEDYLVFLEEHAADLLALDEELTTEAIRRSAAIKARVVSADEREETGPRSILNFGHTIGHAIEAATGYGSFLHGEAVAVGLMGATRLSQLMGLVGPEVVERLGQLLARFGLPTSSAGLDLEALLAAMELDKKVREQTVRWVLLDGIGKTVIRPDVPPELVLQVLAELGAA